MKKALLILNLATIFCFSICAVQAQDADALRVLNSAVEALGGEANLRSFDSIYVRAKGFEHRSADAQGYHPERKATAAHEEKLAVFGDGKRLAYEYKTGRHDGTTRWRRIFFTETQRGIADFVSNFARAGGVRFPSVDRDQNARRIPQIFLLEILANRDSLEYIGTRNFEDKEHEVISLKLPEAKAPILLYFDKKTHLLSKYEFSVDFPALGETLVEYTFSDYQKHPKLNWFHGKHAIKSGGEIWREMKTEEVSVDSKEAEALLELPPELQGFITPPGAVREIAEGVYMAYGIGGAYQPLFIEFKDFILAVEAPASHPSLEETPVESLADPDNFSEEFIAKIKQTVKNKPIKYIVPTHYHSDHAGGLRAFSATGAIALTTPGNEAFFKKYAPDLKIETFENRRVISDGERTVELINVGENPHTAENIIIYLPKEKYLYQGDLFYFFGDSTFPPGDRLTVMPFFARWLKKNNLAPERIYGFHSVAYGTMKHIEEILRLSDSK